MALIKRYAPGWLLWLLAIKPESGSGKSDGWDEFGRSSNDQDRRAPVAGRLIGSLLVIAAALYLPFCWVVLVGPAMARFDTPTRLQLWLVIPGFLPGLWLFHPQDRLEWISWAVTTFGLLAGLTVLGAGGPRRFWVAVGLALFVAIPSSIFGYVIFVLN